MICQAFSEQMCFVLTLLAKKLKADERGKVGRGNSTTATFIGKEMEKQNFIFFLNKEKDTKNKDNNNFEGRNYFYPCRACGGHPETVFHLLSARASYS